MSRARGCVLAALVIAGAAIAACGDDVGVDPVPIALAPTADGGALGPDAPSTSPPDGGVDAAPVRADFGLDTRPVNTTCRAPSRPVPAAGITLERVFANVVLPGPSMIAQPPGDATRWFASILTTGQLLSFPVANPPDAPPVVCDLPLLAGIPLSASGESGFLGFAFHPKFEENGRIYVSWNSTGGPNDLRSRVGVITSPDGGATFTSYADVLVFDQPTSYHHGGGIAFGPDGTLYLSFGNGLAVDAQIKTGFFAKILRIDVDNVPPGQTYGIPPDNPWKSGGGEPAAYAWGFRNPFRFGLDRATGDLWVGDVGESTFEEIDRVRPGGNYGWPCVEAFQQRLDDPACLAVGATSLPPVIDVAHGLLSRAIIGGNVYRGKALPDLVGTYFFGDFETGEVDTLTFDPTTGAPSMAVINGAGPTVSMTEFAEDNDGEMYAVDIGGPIYRIVAAPPAAATFPDRLSKTGCDPRTATGLVPFGVNAPLWSDGAAQTRWLALPDGQTMAVGADGDFDLPKGSVLEQTFAIAGKRVETRLLVRHDDGGWAGYSYEWLDDESDAVLLPWSKRKKVGGGSWTFPSRAECVHCHTEAAGHSLGLELGQLDGDLVYASTNRIANQLRTLEHIGMFGAPLPPLASIVAYPSPTGTGPLDARARAYLYANCSMCHRPSGGGGPGDMDLRFANALVDTKTCNVDAHTGDLGVAGAKLLVPGDASKSHLSIRPHALDYARMPTLATSVVDTADLAVVDAWIASLAACP